MPNYQNGKIYKIINYENDDIYIGSTCEKLSRRIAGHRANFKQYLDGNHNYITSFKILENPSATIVLIENFPCNSKEELTAREAFHIRENNCVNKYIPLRTDKEYREDNKEIISQKAKDRYKNDDEYREQMKEKSKKYREENKEYVKDWKADYYIQNKEQLSEQKKMNYEQNKEAVKARTKAYYEANKEAILQRRKDKRKEKAEAKKSS